MHTTTYKIDDHERPTVYSKGNFIQYSLVTYLVEESEQEWVCVYL